MKRILLLLLFNVSIVAAFGQANGYFKSTHIINSDSTHGELDGTEYINAAGKFRYKENGVWKYRLSTAGANATFVKLTGNETIAGIKTFSTPIATGSGGTGLSTYTTGDLIQATATNTLGKLSSVATGNVLLSGGVGAISSWGKVALSTHVSGTLPVANGGTGLSSLGSALQVLRVNAGGTALEFAAASSGITNSADANEMMKSDGTNAVASGLFSTTAGDLLLGSGLAGASRTITADGSAADVSITVGSKGNSGTFTLQSIGGHRLIGAGRTTIGASQVAVRRLDVIESDANNASMTYPIRLEHQTTGTPAAGIGTGVEFVTETSASNNEIGSTIESIVTDATLGSEDFDLVFKTMAAGATAAERIRIGLSSGMGSIISQGNLGLVSPSGAVLVVDNASTNTNIGSLQLRRTTTGTAGVGIGTNLSYQLEDGSGNQVSVGAVSMVTTDVTAGSVDADFVFTNMQNGAGAAETFRITSVGNATLVGTGTGVDWVATSDRRLKYHFKPVSSQLDKISAISDLVTNYDRKDNGRNETGFVAQELLKVAPEYVVSPRDTASGYYAVNYAKMTPILFKGVDELQEEVSELRQEVAELKAIIKEFRRITLEASAK